MATATYEIKVRLDEQTARRVRRTAEGIGLSPAAAAKVMLKRFAEEGGFPFEVRAPLEPDYARIPRAKVENGRLVMPAGWDDGDDD